MPERHEYQCLNPNCPSQTNTYRASTFIAMNDNAECPQCGAIKVADLGIPKPAPEAPYVIGAQARSDIKNSDKNLRRVAERYGMTDMNNKDGMAVKRAPSSSPLVQMGPTVNVGGAQVPIDAAIGGACISLPGMAQKLKGTWSGAGSPNAGMPSMAGMTNVVGRHDG